MFDIQQLKKEMQICYKKNLQRRCRLSQGENAKRIIPGRLEDGGGNRRCSVCYQQPSLFMIINLVALAMS